MVKRPESFGETLKLEYAGCDYLGQLGADFKGSGFSTMVGKYCGGPIFRLIGTLVFPRIFLSVHVLILSSVFPDGLL
jgi:hypothetical protein